MALYDQMLNEGKPAHDWPGKVHAQ